MTAAMGTDLLAAVRSGAWLEDQVFPPVRYALRGVIPEGMTLFVGPPKIGKSWFLLLLLLTLATGGWMFGTEVPKRPVLYLALEDGDRRLQSRCRRLLTEAPIPSGFEYLIQCQPGMLLATVKEWLALHAAEAPVVVLDTLGKVLPPALPGESSYQRDYRIGSALKGLVDDVDGACLIVCHHDRKAESADFIDAVSGSNGLAGSADTIVLLSRSRHELEGTIQVTGRDVPEGQYAVRYVDGCRWEIIGDTLQEAAAKATEMRAQQGLADRSAEVVRVVSEASKGVRAADVAAVLGIDAKTASTYLGRLADTGRIQRSARGLYTPVGSVGTVGTDTGSHTPNTNNRGLWEDE